KIRQFCFIPTTSLNFASGSSQLIKVSSFRRRGGAGPEDVGKRMILRAAKWRKGLEGRLLSGYGSETLENVLAPVGEGADSWAVQPASAPSRSEEHTSELQSL